MKAAMEYEACIGLEVHVQLKTRSKMFCACSAEFGDPPNTHVCPVCLGYPGAMPVMNRQAIEWTVRTGLMLGSTVPSRSKFDRKSYFYPDMPKNYQISQYDQPFCVGGAVVIDWQGGEKSIALTRIHLEEDVGKSMHFAETSGVDFNRAGVPLMEIVTEPVIRSPEEAEAFLQTLRQIVRYAGVSEGNMECGNIRCDVNCSLRPRGRTQLGAKAELKNLNTVKGVVAALRYEIRRQTAALDGGERVAMETRRWDPDAGTTSAMRSKEEAHDYRYFPEPDLMPVVIAREQLDAWQQQVPEAPRARRRRFEAEYGLPAYDSGVLCAEKDVADYFEQAAGASSNAKAVSNWMMTEMLAKLAESGRAIAAIPLEPTALAALVRLVDEGAVNMPTAKALFGELFENGGDPATLVRERGWGQLSGDSEMEEMAWRAVADNEKSAADYRAGKQAALQHLVGQIMRISRGRANPRSAAAALRALLDNETQEERRNP
jgi:aspartyl-tRNA(Asn)/glutamyl-tRNA(Gln) amidotransferase subunit B